VKKEWCIFHRGVTSVGNKKVTAVAHGGMMGKRPNQIGVEYEAYTGFPNNVLEYPNVIGNKALHPTQKPVELFKYLQLTYTNEGDTVLDNCAGSFTTAIAADNIKRNWICIEQDAKYCEIGKKRINENRERLNALGFNLPILD
jgi:DNA modification methylase